MPSRAALAKGPLTQGHLDEISTVLADPDPG
jgi:hypothetical protein